MKRVNSDRGGGGMREKRQRNADGYGEALAEGKFELRFLLPTKCAGAVIGRGGEKIKTIREKFNAVLTVPDKSTPERVFTVVVVQEHLADCLQEILTNLSEFKELKNKKDEFELRILVHQSMAGAIIGRKGEKIKELREQTGANLKVFSECAPMSTDRVMMISAPQEKIPDIVKQLVDFMKEIPIKGHSKPYDAGNYDPRMAVAYGGYSAGNGMPGQFAGPPQMRGAAIDPFEGGRGAFEAIRGPAAGYSSQSSYGNQSGSIGHFGDYARPPYGTGANASYMGGSNAMPYGSGTAPTRTGTSAMGGSGAYDVTTTQVTIPDELAGTIIGKGGERINRIRQESGARIDIGATMYQSNERIITITGTTHQIQSAQYHLQQSVRTSEAGRRYLSQQQR